MLKGAFVELDPDMDCIGSVTAFKYMILDGRIEAMKTGAVL
jgi:nanoRNase/pAp phosphatase (c-di-AMP/oligoRNAs hydrolase)